MEMEFEEHDLDGFASHDTEQHSIIPMRDAVEYAQQQTAFAQSSHKHMNSTGYDAIGATPAYVNAPAPYYTPGGLHNRGYNAQVQASVSQQSQYPSDTMPSKNSVMDSMDIVVTEENVLSSYQFFIHPTSHFVNVVSVTTIIALCFDLALAVWAICIVQFQVALNLSPFRYVAIIGWLIQTIGTVGAMYSYSINNTTLSLNHCIGIASPIIWSNAVLILATFVLQNYVSDYGSVVHASHVNLFSRLMGICTLFVVNFAVAALLSIEALFCHRTPEERAPQVNILLGTTRERFESSQLYAEAKRLYDDASNGRLQ